MSGDSHPENKFGGPITDTPRSGYLHIPFCRHRCGYCNFSVLAKRDELVDRFLDALDQELESWQQPELDTVFIGGGTPTHLDTAQLMRFLEIMDRRIRRLHDCEVTMEANPEDITSDKLTMLSEAGVNRISLGVQSFDNRKVKRLERGHDRTQAIGAIELASEFIPNVSIDLIFGAPQETLATWQDDLKTAVQMPIQHLSTYSLTIEKGTRFFSRYQRGELKKVDETTDVAMYQAAQDLSARAGFDQYEVSSFATGNHRCRHNLAYWHGQGWYAAGPGAAAFVDGTRWVNHRSVTTYIKKIEEQVSPIAEQVALSPTQIALELAAFGVRMIDGIDLLKIQSRTGVDLRELCDDEIKLSIRDKLVQQDGDHLRLTAKGILFADSVAARFLNAGGDAF